MLKKELKRLYDILLEDYLCNVVSSEIPKNFNMEAQKAQAVCARTYAVNCMENENSKYKEYDAHVDDSVSYQVYNRQQSNENAKTAVSETKGKILTYNEQAAEVFYFSSSCGYTADAKEVFGQDAPYMISAIQTTMDWQTVQVISVKNNDTILENISSVEMIFDENEFGKFLKIRDSFIESDTPWFSWSVNISQDNMVKMIKNAGYNNVTIVNNINVTQRGKGGIAKEILIETQGESINITGQYEIRSILAPMYDEVLKNDKTKALNMTMLPSAFFTITKNTNGSFTIEGGGYGHGTGMSQYGADCLADLGKSYEEILSHYFFGTKICNLSF